MENGLCQSSSKKLRTGSTDNDPGPARNRPGSFEGFRLPGRLIKDRKINNEDSQVFQMLIGEKPELRGRIS